MARTAFYYLHPLLAGPIEEWGEHLDRIAAMGFGAVIIAPLFRPGASGDLFLTADHNRLDPRLGTGDAVEALARWAQAAVSRGLRPMLDLVVDRVAAEATENGAGAWYGSDTGDEPPDPRRAPREPGVARLQSDSDIDGFVAAWSGRLAMWADAGIVGFRCVWPHRVPPPFWRQVIGAMKERPGTTDFIAWTPGLDDAAAALAACGFDRAACCTAAWDYRSDAFAEAIEGLAPVAPAIAAAETPFDYRLSRGFADSARARRAAARAIGLGAAWSAGWLMPMGFEYGATRMMDPARDRPDDFAHLVSGAPFDLTAHIAAANARCADEADGRAPLTVRSLSPPGAPAAALLLDGSGSGGRQRLMLINASVDEAVLVAAAPLLTASGLAGAVLDDGSGGPPVGPEGTIVVAPGEVKLFRPLATTPVDLPAPDALTAAANPRIAIEGISPSVNGGRFAAKRLVGDMVEVAADLIADGHDRLAAALLWRAADEPDWREAPMRSLGNDRWAGRFPLSRLGRHLFTVLAWKDRFGNFAEELEKKHAAGQPIELELEEGRLLVDEAAVQTANPEAAARLAALAASLASAGPDERRRLLLAPATAEWMAAARIRPHASRHSVELPVDAERRAAGFASWYELFPRSQSSDPVRPGTFDDVIARLPAIRDMGFDVLYFPPIHPIGRTNRKGRDNSSSAAPGDPGSPYAIGSAEGGHDAINPALGTLDDFRRLREAAAAHGLEVALDFAVQCSPDHPWLREHPDWFQWRPDGSIRYAENPPKKYEDIVNVDFYTDAAVPGLWLALRDVVLFWAGYGVRLFRVDNPHTKPLPFWEWLIAEVRARFPDAIFLGEAFTRPKPMYRLAKLGFSQSYTYFTWRNTKTEVTEYLTELTTTARDFFRPHFFVNTPDINPAFLQTSGRPGFLIRAALAATLSGLFGVYSGFELCEAQALPGREEYLHSEKYEIRARDWNAPGNIIAELTRLNSIRRTNPALQTHLGITFLNAFNDQILYYAKATEDLQNVVLVAVNLDPQFPQECDIEVPLWFWRLSDAAAATVEDLMTGHSLVWYGKVQHIRLDPASLPFAVWRIQPVAGTR